MKVAIYCRVSTEDQHAENQEAELREYCRRAGHEIYELYTDHYTGRVDSRPEFNRLMDDMRLRRFAGVVVWKLDRLGRSLQHLLQILQEFQNKGIEFISVTQSIDTTTASGKLLFHIMGAFAEFESTLISERTRLGMARAKRDGKHVGRPRKDKKCIVSGCRRKVTFPARVCSLCREDKRIIGALKREGLVFPIMEAVSATESRPLRKQEHDV